MYYNNVMMKVTKAIYYYVIAIQVGFLKRFGGL